MIKKKTSKKTDKYLTINDLAEFTEEVLLPAVKDIVIDVVKAETEKIIDFKLGKQNIELRDYIDKKMDETKGDIISYMQGDHERDKNWKMKVINILKRQKMAKPDEIKILTDLIR
jgi:hypothetical protein